MAFGGASMAAASLYAASQTSLLDSHRGYRCKQRTQHHQAEQSRRCPRVVSHRSIPGLQCQHRPQHLPQPSTFPLGVINVTDQPLIVEIESIDGVEPAVFHVALLATLWNDVAPPPHARRGVLAWDSVNALLEQNLGDFVIEPDGRCEPAPGPFGTADAQVPITAPSYGSTGLLKVMDRVAFLNPVSLDIVVGQFSLYADVASCQAIKTPCAVDDADLEPSECALLLTANMAHERAMIGGCPELGWTDCVVLVTPSPGERVAAGILNIEVVDRAAAPLREEVPLWYWRVMSMADLIPELEYWYDRWDQRFADNWEWGDQCEDYVDASLTEADGNFTLPHSSRSIGGRLAREPQPRGV